MIGASITNSTDPALDWMQPPVLRCSCAICASGSVGMAARPTSHVMAQAMAAENRGAERIAQYKDEDGFYHFSGDRNIDAVLIGTRWTGTALTFSFPDSESNYGSGYDYGQATLVVPFNEAQKVATREAFAMVSSYTNLTFTEVAPDAAERPTFRLASTALPATGSASGYFPDTPGDLSGDIWFGRSQQPYYETPERGNWGYGTILHEIGHTLGLKHGQSDYTTEDLSDYFGGSTPFFGSRALEYRKDGQGWSVMTYTNGPNVEPIFNGDEYNQPQTYMMYDIAAMQYLYGANYATNAGDTVYKWNPLNGELSVNGVARGAPTGNKVFETVWDGGGTDTYDFSDYQGALRIDLRPGEITTLTEEQQPNLLAYDGRTALFAGNVGNALLFRGNTASLIENAVGGGGDDRIMGNQANNRLDGGAGNDLLVGGLGSDLLIGGAGNDVADFTGALSGITITFNNNAADIIVANGGDRDVLRGIEGAVGTAFADTLIGDRADNFLSGGAGGRDYLNGGEGNDTLIGAGDAIVEVDKPDMIVAIDAGNNWRGDAISLDGWFDLVPGPLLDAPADIPHATVRGVGANGSIASYSFTAEAGARGVFDLDGVLPGMVSLRLLDADGNLVANGFSNPVADSGSREGRSPFFDVVFQKSGTYFIEVGGFLSSVDPFGNGIDGFGPLQGDTPYILNVSIEGATVETQVTAAGSGRYYGGAGDDMIVGSTGDDLIAGGSGIDTLSYAAARNGVTVDLTRTTAQNTGAGRDSITGIENLIGSRYADTLRGDAGANVIDGGGGSDTIDGGAGRDTLSFASARTGITFGLALQGAAQDVFGGRTITASNFEDLLGGRFDDVLTGDAGANLIRGGAGDDVLAGSQDGLAGGVDTLDGGDGFDTASFVANLTGVTATLRQGGTGEARDASANLLANLVGIEALRGGAGRDTLTGDEGANRLEGGAGDDRLFGGRGDDTIIGGAGDDLIDGGEGIDTAAYDGDERVIVDLAIVGPQATGRGNDTLVGIENLRGSDGDDTLRGNDRDNVFFDTRGNDIYDGRGGNDTVDYSAARYEVRVDLREEGFQDTRGGGTDKLVDIENVTGGNLGNTLNGNDRENRLVGGAMRDVLFGGLGDDYLEGGDGQDLLVGDGSARLDNPDGRSLNDTLIGGAGHDILIGGEGDDLLRGGTGNDTLIGSMAIVERYGDSYRAESLVPGYGGRDTLDGGEGEDYGILNLAGISEAVRVDNRVTSGTNAIYYDGVAYGSLTSIERLRIVTGNGNDHIQTGAGYDVLIGNDGDDFLSSGAGDDIVNGGAGNDTLDGGEGIDTISFDGATTGITLDLRRTDAQDTGMGIDTILNFEKVLTTQFGDVVHGNDVANEMRDRGGGADRFYGYGGSDLLGVARLYDMAGGEIYLDGGAGDDIVEYLRFPELGPQITWLDYKPADDVTLIGGDGNDTIRMIGHLTGVIDAGAGDDTVEVYVGGRVSTRMDVTLGAGRDTLVIKDPDSTIVESDHRDNIIRDFEVGDSGDRANVGDVLLGSYQGSNPFATGQMRLFQDGDDTLLQIDPDAEGAAIGWTTILAFENTRAADFTVKNFFRFEPGDFFTPPKTIEWDPQARPAGGNAAINPATVFAGADVDADAGGWALMSTISMQDGLIHTMVAL